MNVIAWFFIGIGISGTLGIPLIIWAIKKGREVYSYSRIRGKKGKMFSETELKSIFDPKMLSKVQRSRYWQLIQFSSSREEYEKKLENLSDKEYNKILQISSKKLSRFIKVYYEMKDDFHDLKLILYCIKNKQDKNKIKHLLKSDRYEELLDFDEVFAILNHLEKDKNVRFIDYANYNRFEIIGIEYSLDAYFFKELKKTASTPDLKKLYNVLRTNYLLRQIIRLKELGYKEFEIIDILKIRNKREIELAKKDLSIIISEISKKNKEVRQMIVAGESKYDSLNHYFDNSIIKFISRERYKRPFHQLDAFDLLERMKKEIGQCRNLWLIK